MIVETLLAGPGTLPTSFPADQTPQPGWRPLKSIRHLLKERSPLPEESRETVRIVPLRLNSKDALDFILPTRDQISQAIISTSEDRRTARPILINNVLLNDICPLDGLFFTSTVFMSKSEGSRQKNQMVFPGGEVKMDNGHYKYPEDGVMHLAEQLHLYGIHPGQLKPIGERNYSIETDMNGVGRKKRKVLLSNHEAFFTAEIPPFLDCRPYDPARHIGGIFDLPPDSLEILLREHRISDSDGQPLQLLDSLSVGGDTSARRKLQAKVTTDGREQGICEETLRAAYAFELQTAVEVVEKMLEGTKHHKKAQYLEGWTVLPIPKSPTDIAAMNTESLKRHITTVGAFLQDFEKDYQKFIDNPAEVMDPQAVDQYRQALGEGQSIHRLRSRVQLVSELSLAIQRVNLNHTLRFVKDSGPQKPYLVLQALLKLDEDVITAEFNKLEAECPEVANLYKVACQVFDIDMEKKEWLEKLKDRLTAFRQMKIDRKNGILSLDDNLWYERAVNAFRRRFAHAFGIYEYDLEEISRSINDFFHNYLVKPLSSITDPQTIRGLRPDIQTVGTTELDEVFIRFILGQSQYNDPTPLSTEDRWVAGQRLLLHNSMNEIRKLRDRQIFPNYHTYPFRDTFEIMVKGDLQERESVTIAGDCLYKYELRDDLNVSEVQVALSRRGGDVVRFDTSKYPVGIFSDPHDKSDASLLRKHLERGIPIRDLVEAMKTPDTRALAKKRIRDFFGRMLVVDAEDFKRRFRYDYANSHPFISGSALDETVNQVAAVWTLAAISNIIRYFAEESLRAGFTYTVSKIKDSRTARGIIQSALTNSGTTFEDIGIWGSGASEIDPQWTWVKYVHSLSRDRYGEEFCEEEVQLFPTVLDAEKKKLADSSYASRRIVSTEIGEWGKFPFLFVIAGLQRAIEELLMTQYSN